MTRMRAAVLGVCALALLAGACTPDSVSRADGADRPHSPTPAAPTVPAPAATTPTPVTSTPAPVAADTPATPAPTAEAKRDVTVHVVRSGDTASAIATLHRTTVERIATCNNIDASHIVTGQHLTLRCDKPVVKPSPTPPPRPAAKDTPRPNSSGVMWTDRVAGNLASIYTVPCGGLWNYKAAAPAGKTFYAREIGCAGSARYLSVRAGQKIKIGSKTCTAVGSQNLHYLKDDVSDINWMGDTIVQTCYKRGGGPVKLVNFNCRS